MIHDCALTEHYMLFPLMPLTTDLERLKAGGQHWVYDPDFPVVIGVVPRNGRGDQVRWFNAPHAFTGHTINAFEEDGRIVFDTYECDGNGFAAVMPDKHGRMSDPTKVTTRAVRWRIDYHAASPVLTDRQVLFVADGEGPHIDPRRMCRSYRHVFAPTLNRSRLITDRNGRVVPVFFNQLTHFDLATGRREDWYAGEGATLQDPVYFPRSATAEEDDGYLIVVLNRPLEKSNELVILQSRRLGAGPVARLRLPVRLRLGIHSNWIDGSLVPSWR
jgi:carotenoid cleavage dioxygenase